MRNPNKIVAAVVLLALGCAQRQAPSGWLAGPEEFSEDLFGAWAIVDYDTDEQEETRLMGELIAVDPERLVILRGAMITTIPRRSVRAIRLERWDPQTGRVGNVAFVGALSTLSHGFWLILTLPVWILIGAGASATASRLALVHYPDVSWDELSRYARFPGGTPEGLDLDTLTPKPAGE